MQHGGFDLEVVLEFAGGPVLENLVGELGQGVYVASR